MEFTHIANPVRVEAQVIRDVTLSGTDYRLTLEDGTEFVAGPSMTVRHAPQTGDYLVRQDDGYEYLNPKDVFERKYRAIGAQMESKVSGETAGRNYSDIDLRNQAMNYASRHYEAGSAAVVKAAEAYYQFLKGAA